MTEQAGSTFSEPAGGPTLSSPAIGPTPADSTPPSFIVAEPVEPPGRAPSSDVPPQRPLRWRELLAVVLLVVLCDVTIYRGEGFAGCAVLFLLAPGLLLWGSPRPRLRTSFWIVGAMLIALAARMAWLGSALGVAAGFALLAALALAILGRRPYVLDVLACAAQTIAAGYLGLMHYRRSAGQLGRKVPHVYWLGAALPLAAIAVFGTLFVLANPDLATAFNDALSRFFRWVRDRIDGLLPTWGEVVFWAVVAWVSIGLLRPVLRRSVLARFSRKGWPAPGESTPAETPLYAAIRNMLVAVIVLFVVYLGFEFNTLWFREFPKNFYYAGYAHEGAAWLTVALALATVVLSLVFRGRVLRDPRLPQLRRLAWLWSAENLILAAAVYNRLWIYIGFNGMTRMRTVGLFGISAVVAGFLLVVGKIVRQRDFVWLLRRHLWTLAVAAYLFALTPVDALVHTYNVRRVLAGDLAPSVQIGWHPVNAEGLLVLRPLVQSDDEIIREGIRALLAGRAVAAEATRQLPSRHWSTFQLADHLLARELDATQEDWQPYADPSKRAAAWERFRGYVYQWY